MKKVISLVLCSLLVFGMAACGGGTGGTTTTAASTATTAAADANTTTAAADANTTTAAAENNAGGSSASGLPASLPVLSPDNPITLTSFVITTYPQPANDNRILKRFKDELGVTLEMDIIAQENQFEKIGVMIAGGDYPDIIASIELNARMVDADAMIPYDDYIDAGLVPNIAEFVAPYRKKMSHAGDGKLYILADSGRLYNKNVVTEYSGSAMWIQKAVLAEFGYPEVKTLDEYFDLIEKYAAKYPTIEGQPTIGFETQATAGKEFTLTNAPGALVGNPNDSDLLVDHKEGPNQGTAQIFADKDAAKRYFQKLNEMNAKGLVDKEAFTQSYDQYIEKCASGRVLGFFDQGWNVNNARNSLKASGRDERTWVATIPTFDNIAPWWRDAPAMNREQGFGISATSPKKDYAFAFIDKLLEEEWQIYFNWGVEGTDYLVNEEGRYYQTPEMRASRLDTVWKATNLLECFYNLMPKRAGSYSNGNSYIPAEQPEEFWDSLSEYDKNFLTAYGKKTWADFTNDPPENPVYYPAWTVALPDGSDAQMSKVQLTETQVQYLPRVILADPADFDAEWQKYVEAIAKCNIKAYEDYVTEQNKIRIAEWTTK